MNFRPIFDDTVPAMCMRISAATFYALIGNGFEVTFSTPEDSWPAIAKRELEKKVPFPMAPGLKAARPKRKVAAKKIIPESASLHEALAKKIITPAVFPGAHYAALDPKQRLRVQGLLGRQGDVARAVLLEGKEPTVVAKGYGVTSNAITWHLRQVAKKLKLKKIGA